VSGIGREPTGVHRLLYCIFLQAVCVRAHGVVVGNFFKPRRLSLLALSASLGERALESASVSRSLTQPSFTCHCTQHPQLYGPACGPSGVGTAPPSGSPAAALPALMRSPSVVAAGAMRSPGRGQGSTRVTRPRGEPEGPGGASPRTTRLQPEGSAARLRTRAQPRSPVVGRWYVRARRAEGSTKAWSTAARPDHPCGGGRQGRQQRML